MINVFRACYADWKLIKTRSCIQIVLEIPIEKADEAYQVLGGMPLPGKEFWVAVARLNSDAVTPPIPQAQEAPKLTGPRQVSAPHSAGAFGRRKFETLPYSAQAALRCNEPVYRAFLGEGLELHSNPRSPEDAATVVRRYCCDVASRANILPDTAAGQKWLELEAKFEAWKLQDRVA